MSAEKIQELTPKDQVVALVANDCVDTAIIALNEKYKGLKAVDEDSFTLVKKGLKEYVSRRTAIEDRRLSLKRDVDAEAKRITLLLAPGEAALKKEKDAWDDKAKAAAAEKERLNKVRIEKIQARIATFSVYLQNIMTKSAGDLKSDLDFLKSCIIADTFNYEEFINDAEKIKVTTEKALFDAYTQRKALEDREAEVTRQRDELARQQETIDAANRIIAEKVEADRLEQERVEAVERDKKEESLIEISVSAYQPMQDNAKIMHTTDYQVKEKGLSQPAAPTQGSSAMRPMIFDGGPNDPLIKSGMLKQWDEIETNASIGQDAKLNLLVEFVKSITVSSDLNGHRIVGEAYDLLNKIGVSK